MDKRSFKGLAVGVAMGVAIGVTPVAAASLIHSLGNHGEIVALRQLQDARIEIGFADGWVGSCSRYITSTTTITTTVKPQDPPPPVVDPVDPPAHGNCGVGNGVDPDTPGCKNGRNDGPGTSPGHPGARGGNGNGKGPGKK